MFEPTLIIDMIIFNVKTFDVKIEIKCILIKIYLHNVFYKILLQASNLYNILSSETEHWGKVIV